MTLPTPFLVIGSMKSGTETITQLLRSHSEIELLTEKETTSFSSAEGAARFYRKYGQSSARAAGEVSTGYMQRPAIQIDYDAIRDLFEDQIKLIAILRDPFSRATSHWRHWAQLGYNPPGTLEAHLANPNGPYVAFSSYHRQLLPWIDCFGKDAILPIKLDSYSVNPLAVERRLSDFLGLSKPFNSGGEVITANTADHRVVSKGWGRKLARSRPYRAIKPLLPTFMRTGGAMILGGARGGQELDPTSMKIEADFRNAIAEDLARLKREWSFLDWTEHG